MSKKELITIFVLSTAVFLLANFAQFWGFIRAPSDMVFLGGHLPNSGEILNLAFAQLKEGHVLVKNLFTSERQPGIFFPSSYYPLILLTKMGIADFFVFLIGKAIYTFFLLLVFWRYQGLSVEKYSEKLVAIVLLCFGGGLGFILKYFLSRSVDLWIPEATIFHAVLYSSNFVFAQLLMLVAFYFLARFWINKRTKELIFVALAIFILSLEHQFSALTVISSAFFCLIFTQKTTKHLVTKGSIFFLTFLPALSSFLIQFLLIKHYPNVEAWVRQTYLDNPSLLSFVSGFGLIGILAFRQILTSVWEKMTIFHKLNLFWILSSVLLVYSPLSFHRRFLEGIFIPMVIFATPQFIAIYRKTPVWLMEKVFLRRTLVVLFLLLVSSTNVYLVYQDISVFSRKQQNSPFYIYREDQKALDYLKEHSVRDDIVLADGYYSPLIPGLIGRTVYFGHSVGTALTIRPQRKIEDARKFFLEDDENYRQDFLKKNKIKYLFLGKKASGEEGFAKWEEKKYLKKIYQGDGVKIFRVI